MTFQAPDGRGRAAGRPVLGVARATLPFLAILGFGVLLITYFPWLTLAPLAWFQL